MAELLNVGFLDTVHKEIKTKLLTMEGDIIIGTHGIKSTTCLLKEAASVFYVRNLADDGNMPLSVGAFYTSMIDLHTDKRIVDLKVFHSTPILADMDVGEFALGWVSSAGYYYFKPNDCLY